MLHMKPKMNFCFALGMLALALGCATKPKEAPAGRGIGDPYFANVRSKANVYAPRAQLGVVKIAVMPFKASTELIGSSVSDMVVTELLRTQKYQLVERGQMNQVLSETELAMAGLSEAKAVEAAKMLGAESVVIGTVDEYGQQAKGGDTYAVVGLAIRLIDCSNGKIIWSADLAKMAKDEDTPLPKHARDVVHELVAGLYQNFTGQEESLPPPTPEGVSVSEMGLREATVKWTIPPFHAKYRVERSYSDQGPFTSVGEANASAGRFVDKSGLKDSTVYYYRVCGVGRTGIPSDPSSVVETMTAPPPDPPTGVAAAALSSRCNRVTWQPPSSEGLASYRVERALAGSDDWKTVAERHTETEFVDGGRRGCELADATVYRYRVFAVNRVGSTSEASEEVEIETAPPPSAVEDFAAESDCVRNVPLAWRESDDPDVDGYEIERATESGGFIRLARVSKRTTTSYLDGGDPGRLNDFCSYCYRIRAFNKVGAFSEWSTTQATTKAKPYAPTGLRASRTEPGAIVLEWQPNPESDIVEYRVESRNSGKRFWRKVATTTACRAEEKGLRPSDVRIFRVMAVGPKNLQSNWSAECEGAARPLPQAPSGVAAAKCDEGFRISFRPLAQGAASFNVYRRVFGRNELIKRVNEPEAVVPAPSAGRPEDIFVTSIDECGLESLPSEKVTIRN